MKGYKIGINENLLDFVLIELEVPEEYPGVLIYPYAMELIADPLVTYEDGVTFNTGIYYTGIKWRVTSQYRTNVARVLDIRKIKTGIAEHVDSAFSLYDQTFDYHPGEIIYPKAFDLDHTNMCTDGIHFFETMEDAIKYTKDRWVRARLTLATLGTAFRPPRCVVPDPWTKGVYF